MANPLQLREGGDSDKMRLFCHEIGRRARELELTLGELATALVTTLIVEHRWAGQDPAVIELFTAGLCQIARTDPDFEEALVDFKKAQTAVEVG